MNIKIKSILTVVSAGLIVFGFGISLLLGDKKIYSDAERRKLEEFPKVNLSEIQSGDYMTDFENASVDQFPMRDFFRKIKAYTVTDLLMQSDNNGVFTCDGHISKLEYPLKYEMLDHAVNCFENIYSKYFKGTDSNVYFSVIPDKNMFLAEKNNILAFDYNEMISYMKQKMSYMKYIDIVPFLSAEDYYHTDSHWKQERITDIADFIADSMGTHLADGFNENTVNERFYGVYYGQSALDFSPDMLVCLTNKTIENLVVTIYPNGVAEKSEVYDMEKAFGKDPYEMFLSGSQPIVEIENPENRNGRKLVIFRDSFGSSLAPLLASGYSKITLIDTRYVQPSMLSQFIGNDTDDVLFIYSSLILNSSLALR